MVYEAQTVRSEVTRGTSPVEEPDEEEEEEEEEPPALMDSLDKVLRHNDTPWRKEDRRHPFAEVTGRSSVCSRRNT